MLSMLDEWEEVKLKREKDWIMKDYPEVHREPQSTTIRGVKPVACF